MTAVPPLGRVDRKITKNMLHELKLLYKYSFFLILVAKCRNNWASLKKLILDYERRVERMGKRKVCHVMVATCH